MSITVYGIPNCDSIKQTKQWLEARGLPYHFHDYKKDGVDVERLTGWVKRVGWDKVLNRAGTTFRKLPDEDKKDITEEKAIALMAANPSMIKRPIAEYSGGLMIGFVDAGWQAALG